MMNPWFAAALVIGLFLSRRIAGKISQWRPFVILGSFAVGGLTFVALVLRQEYSSLPETWDLPLSLLIGAAFGIGAGVLDLRDEGYLVRGDEPEEELGR